MIGNVGYQSGYMRLHPGFTGYNQAVKRLKTATTANLSDVKTVLGRVATEVRRKGKHTDYIFKGEERPFPVPMHGKELSMAITSDLKKLLKRQGIF